MRAKSQKHAEYEIVGAMLYQFTYGPVFKELGGVTRDGIADDPIAYNRVSKACKKLKNEIVRKQEKLRKYLPEDHVDYLGKDEAIE